MVNCNPETVSTDYDTSDRLYFEPLTLEDVLEIVHAEQQAGPIAGVICQLGGQTPLGLAQGLADAGVPIVGTSPEAIHLAEERGAFGRVLAEAGLPAPKHGMASSFAEAQAIAAEIGYPVLVRPSYVLGGRGMEIVYDDDALRGLHRARATEISPEHPGAGRPVHRRRGRDRRRRAVRRRRALPRRRDGAHRGGRHPLRRLLVRAAADHARREPRSTGSARPPRRSPAGVGVRGLINIQFALGSDVLYVLEANPRAIAHGAVRLQGDRHAAGQGGGPGDARASRSPTLRAAGVLPAEGDGGDLPADPPIAVKEAVMPFNRFKTPDGRNVDTVLGPEMKSTGEVMGFDADFGTAFAKAQAAAYGSLPTDGPGLRVAWPTATSGT